MASDSTLRYTGESPESAGKSLCLWTLWRAYTLPRKREEKMPKLKTHKGAAKRFKKTGTGKIVRHQTKTRHILSSKSPKVKRKLGKSVIVSDGDHLKVARMIPYA